MNRAVQPPVLTLGALALAAVGLLAPDDLGPEAGAWSADLLPACLEALRTAPAEADRRLVALADALGLDDAELMTVALCTAVEQDAGAARAVAAVQAPVGGSRPLLGLAATAFAGLGAGVLGLACGRAAACGLLQLGEEPLALPERSLRVPLPILAVLAGLDAPWPNTVLLPASDLPLPIALLAEATARARAIGRGGLVVRCASAAEALAAAGLVARTLGVALARVEGETAPGFAAWLIAADRAPVFVPRLGPGERWRLPELAPYAGPWLVATGPEGIIEAETAPDEWLLPVPDLAQRADLWTAAGAPPAVAARAAESYRQGAGRIAEAAGRARLQAVRHGREQPAWEDVAAGVALGAGALAGLARHSAAAVPDEALVLPPRLREGLERLLERARMRSRLHEQLGPAVTSRYRPGVRALLFGDSGAGKTLAAHWLATRLGLPLYRVDLAALTSKWIGETEKNLSAVLSAAEHADVLLFFDEADALFASRTDVSDANDRHANAQTNYLLQRIEEFDGVAVLASNSRERFDPAFVRRLDAILEFPLPDAPARRALWLAHLGAWHTLAEAELDRLAVRVDFAGGHIRNVVLAAAARDAAGGRPIVWGELKPAVAEEYAKLGRAAPELGP